jgi:hypothetical protein
MGRRYYGARHKRYGRHGDNGNIYWCLGKVWNVNAVRNIFINISYCKEIQKEGTLMKMPKDIHLMRIDTTCPECDYRNQGEYKLEEAMEIICCGKCGNILSKPEDMSHDEETKVRLCVQQALEEGE